MQVLLSRRRFLALSASFAVVGCSGGDGDREGAPASTTPEPPPPTTVGPTTTAAPAPSTTTTDATTTTTEVVGPPLDEDPFVHGVASGDPDTGSVVLWTRLGGALPDGPVPVSWRFVGDDGTEVVGSVETGPDDGHSVHVVVDATGPGTYSFRAGGFDSAEGRTAPIDPDTTEFRLVSASCQNYENGFYAAHRDIAEWAPDLVVFLGDFFYEGFGRTLDDGAVRLHEPFEPTDLDGYRRRYSQYLGDPQLQACRAAAPWVAIWDDHEVDNNYAGLVAQDDQTSEAFAVRRAQAYRAWWENTPTRLPAPDLVADPTARYEIYRGIDVGDLMRLSVLDGRQFRDDQLSETVLDVGPPVDGWDDPGRSMLGGEQEAWTIDRFATSTARWNCLAQQTVFADTTLEATGAILNYDQWDGYAAARDRLLDAAPDDFVVLSGDIHLAGIAELGPPDGRRGVEFVTTGISSGANVDPALADVVRSIPSIVDAELEFRGCTRHTVTPERWTAEFRQVVDLADPDSEVRTWKTFVVESGTPSVTEA